MPGCGETATGLAGRLPAVALSSRPVAGGEPLPHAPSRAAAAAQAAPGRGSVGGASCSRGVIAAAGLGAAVTIASVPAATPRVGRVERPRRRGREQMDARIIDLRYDGRPRTVGAWLCGDVLVDCGPGSCLPRLLEGLGDAGPAGAAADPRPPRPRRRRRRAGGALAGAAGATSTPAGRPTWPTPAGCVASARRVFGERLEELLGEVLPGPRGEPAHDRRRRADRRAATAPGPRDTPPTTSPSSSRTAVWPSAGTSRACAWRGTW